LLESVQQGDLLAAHAFLDRRRHSVWRDEPDRALLWMAAERCLSFLDTAERIDSAWGHQAGDLPELALEGRRRVKEQLKSGSRIECPCGVAFFVALISTIQNRRIQAGTVVLGDPTIQGNIRGLASIVEPLQLSLESGALRALVPLSNKAQFAGLPEDVVEKLDIIFYGDIDRAVLKSVEI
jgi:predicted ATP-dependent Lon-type protease